MRSLQFYIAGLFLSKISCYQPLLVVIKTAYLAVVHTPNTHPSCLNAHVSWAKMTFWRLMYVVNRNILDSQSENHPVKTFKNGFENVMLFSCQFLSVDMAAL